MNKETELILCDILKQEMTLNKSQVWIASQNAMIPNIDSLFVVVGMVDSRIVSSVNNVVSSETGMTEIQQCTMRENYQIDIVSKNDDARTRRAEIVLALNSIYSRQQQEKENFRIFQIPTSFVNTTLAEGGSQLNRFTIIVTVMSWSRKIKQVSSTDYYDSFDTRVDDEKTIVQDWQAETIYNTDDVVYYQIDRKYYICLSDEVSSLPTDTDDWEETTEPKDGIIEFNITE